MYMSFFFLIFKSLLIILAMLGLCCCVGFSLVMVHGLLIVQASLVTDHRLSGHGPQLQHTGSLVAACELRCSVTHGIFPDEGSNPCLLHWQADSSPLSSQESPGCVRHDWATSLSLFTFMYWRRKWQPTPVFLPGESQRWGSLVGCRLWGRTESDTTEAT